MKFFLLIVVYLIPTFTLHALFWESDREKNFSVAIVLPSERSLIGDKIPIQVTVSAPATYKIDDQLIKEQLMNNLNIVSQKFSLIDESVAPHKVLYTIVPKVAGNFFINLLTIPLYNEEGNRVTLTGNIFPIEVTVPSESPRDPLTWSQGVTNLVREFQITVSPENTYRYLNGPEVLDREAYMNRKLVEENQIPYQHILLFLLIGCALYLILKQVIQTIIVIITKPKDPKKQALESISDVNIADDVCYDHISDILREYVEDQHTIPARARTTREIIKTLKEKKPFTKVNQERLTSVLREADLVKFADKSTSEKERRKMVSIATKFIDS